MKLILSILVLSLTVNIVHGASKSYSQKEFDTKLQKELEKEISRIKKTSISQLTKDILKRERELTAKEKEINLKQEQVLMGEESLLLKIQKIEEQQKKVIGCIDKNKNSQAMRIKQLVSMVSNMRPQKAADVLSVQEAKISVKILEKIDPTKASKIFNLMDKEVSARLQKQYLNMQE